jgi:hypothetical protein
MGETLNIPKEGGGGNADPPMAETTFDDGSGDPYRNIKIHDLTTWRMQQRGANSYTTLEVDVVTPVFDFEALPADGQLESYHNQGRMLLAAFNDFELPPYTKLQN